MKYLFFLICVALSLCSCSSLKKTTRSEHTTKDSAVIKSAAFVETKAKDSTGSEKSHEAEKKTSESAYTKTTTIVEEVFSDEFGFRPGDTIAPLGGLIYPPSGIQPVLFPKPIKRITTVIEETGFKNETEEAERIREKAGQIIAGDSLFISSDESVTKTETKDKRDASKTSFILLPWWLWFCCVLIFVCIRIFKSKTYGRF